MRRLLTVSALAVVLASCGGSKTIDGGFDGGVDAGFDAGMDAGIDAGFDAGTDAGVDAGMDAGVDAGPSSAVEYLVVIVQENHTFDNHFGRYCTSPYGTEPTCTTGPTCCEAGPATDPSGASPVTIDDAELGIWDPNHTYLCETEEIDDGGMDRFVTGAGCSDPRNFAYSSQAIIQPYWTLAGQYAIGDRYFQPLVGQSSSNDMYLARAAFEFLDNEYAGTDAIGSSCPLASLSPTTSYSHATIGDLLADAGVRWTFYAEGYQQMKDSIDAGMCPGVFAACPADAAVYPCVYDCTDDPFTYYPSLRDKPEFMDDLSAFTNALDAGTLLPVSFIKARGYKTEHPGYLSKLSDGVGFSTGLTHQILASQYGSKVLVLIIWDEGGGYFDHVPPPGVSPADGKPYGTRLPFLAIGPFVKTNYVSHVQLEHSSIVKFIEWNWLGGTTGQLGTRDTLVNNLGDVLDPAKTGTVVPPN